MINCPCDSSGQLNPVRIKSLPPPLRKKTLTITNGLGGWGQVIGLFSLI
jgi:hypothetical protein